MAIPTSAAQAPPLPAPSTGTAASSTAETRRLERWIDRLTTHPRRIQVALDLTAIGFGVLLLTDMLAPEFLFHCIFVVLTVQAFLFGLRETLWRIGIVSIALAAYEEAPLLGLDLTPMDLVEWPLMFVIAILVAWMADRRQATARQYASLFRVASDRLVTIQDEERRAFSRDLHDAVGQSLTALALTLDSAAAQSRTEDILVRVSSARRLVYDTLQETRSMATRLRPPRLEHVGFLAAVSDLANRSGFPVALQTERGIDDRDMLAPTAAAETFRILQEAVTNAARHSGSAGARISLTADRTTIRVSVTDEGVGFDPLEARGRGLGLASMQERAAAIGGQLSIESEPGQGTKVALVLSRAAGAGR